MPIVEDSNVRHRSDFFMKRFSSVAAMVAVGSLAFARPAFAQQQGGGQNNPANGNGQQQNGQTPRRAATFPLWKAELPGGEYLVARNAINAVSTQQYILDGVARVTEVNISTTGVFQPRFYYLEMIATDAAANVPGAQPIVDAAQTAAHSVVDNAVPSDQQPWAKVVKNYPTTTHAGTIEFRLDTKEQLAKLFESVKRTWLTGRSEVYTPSGTRPFNAAEELKNKDADSDSEGEGGPGTGTSDGGESSSGTGN
jgi:hypothetical protein